MLGTGQIGTPVACQLIDSSNEVVVVSRSGRNVAPGARSMSGDLTNKEFAATSAAGDDDCITRVTRTVQFESSRQRTA